MEREGILCVGLDMVWTCIFFLSSCFPFLDISPFRTVYSPPFVTTGQSSSTVLTELVRRSGRGRGGRPWEVAQHPRPPEGERQRRGGHRGRRGGDEGGQEDQQGLQDPQDIWSSFLIPPNVLEPDPCTRYQTIVTRKVKRDLNVRFMLEQI